MEITKRRHLIKVNIVFKAYSIIQLRNWKIMHVWTCLLPLYVVLPKSSRNLNAARKPLVVQLWASRYRELYPL
jgi:hypothetical protein